MRNIVLHFLLLNTLFAYPRSDLRPGGVLVVPKECEQAFFLGKPGILTERNGTILRLFAIPLSTEPGRYTLACHCHDGNRTRSVTIHSFPYKEQRLKIKNRRKVIPNAEDLRRIRAETVRKREAKAFHSKELARVDFLRPVQGAVSSPFGLRRFFNGHPRAPHRGLDIAAPEGTPVRAAADGMVVETGDFFFSGNLVFLEHGQGLKTLYGHMSRIAVKPGENVKKGQVIGYVGHTGRATGPHLHFGVWMQGCYVDPTIFLPKVKGDGAKNH